jgi:site-specific DNA-methyltransferase (adenine-specific)
MATTTVVTPQQSNFTDQILHGDCIEVMRQMPANSVDFILTDPPYLVNYRDRSGRTIQNDVDESWLKPAMQEAYRVGGWRTAYITAPATREFRRAIRPAWMASLG